MQHSPQLQSYWAALSPVHKAAVTARTKWLQTARPEQIPTYLDGGALWLALAGRGWGKSRSIYEDTWWQGALNPGMRIAVIAPTFGDLKKVTFFGRSGLKAVTPPEVLKGGSFDAAFNVTDRLLQFANGATVQGFPATEPDRLRGPEHHMAVCEELAAWPYAQEAWDMMRMGLRLGDAPKTIIATTPRPMPIVRNLIKREDCKVVRGKTYDNKANLSDSYITDLQKRYEGTRLGRQELFAEVLDDAPGALWTRDSIKSGLLPQMQRIVVAIDPSGASGDADEAADSIGIVAAGKGIDGRFYVLEDATCRLSPSGWARRAVERYRDLQADVIVAERNFGGDMVLAVIKTADKNANVKLVTASRGKAVRAEPIAALYEQGRVTHAPGLEALEDQMCVAKGTLIETARGQVPIETVTTHDLVMTRNGFAPIKWAGYTGQAKRLIEIETRNSKIRVTECHPIYLPETCEFVSARSVKATDNLLESPRWERTGLPLLGGAGGITGWSPVITAMPKENCCTAPFTKRISGLFLKVTTSTTTTKILQIISLATSSASRLPNMLRATIESGLTRLTPNPWGAVRFVGPPPLPSGQRQPAGFAPIPARNAATGQRSAPPRPLSKSRASHAEQSSAPYLNGSGCSVMSNARTTLHVRSQKSDGEPVYNLSVADGFLPEYYANGILTHNCMMTLSGYVGDGSPDRVDALVWALTELALGGTEPFQWYAGGESHQ